MMNRKGRHAVIEEECINRAKQIIANLKYGDQTIAAISILLSGLLHLTSEQIGMVIGVSQSAVIRMNGRFRKTKQTASTSWGGDRRSIMKVDETTEVLRTLEDQASRGEVVVVNQVKVALEEKRGKHISLQTAYNILYRNGWRKVKPDKEHPKSDPQKQEEFKKKHFRRRYIWQSIKHQQKIDK